ncbi:MAG: SH3 domain-containing protein [Anaerolineae bacterium]
MDKRKRRLLSCASAVAGFFGCLCLFLAFAGAGLYALGGPDVVILLTPISRLAAALGATPAQVSPTPLPTYTSTPASVEREESTPKPSPSPKATDTPQPTKAPSATPSMTLLPAQTHTPTGTPTKTSTPTPTPTPIPIIAVASTTLRVRGGPGTEYETLDKLAEGDKVEILGRNESGDWLLVRLEEGDEGWISAAFVEASVNITEEVPLAPKIPAPPSPTPAPTAQETAKFTPIPPSEPTVAPEPFWPIGTSAQISPHHHGVTGTAVLFQPRTITVINFNFDGQVPTVEIRLGHKGFPKHPVAVLGYLEQRQYKNETLQLQIPPELPPGSADAIFFYCLEFDMLLGWGEFKVG